MPNTVGSTEVPWPSSLPRLAHVVVDQNRLRDSALVRALQDEHERSGQAIVLGWSAHFELTKGTSSGMVASLRPLARRPNAVFSAYTSGVIHSAFEREALAPTSSIVDPGSTANLRALLRVVSDGRYSPWQLAQAHSEMAVSARRQMAARQNDLLFKSTIPRAFRETPASEINAVRRALTSKPPNRTPFRESLAESFTQTNLAAIMSGEDSAGNALMPMDVAAALVKGPSITVVHIITLLSVFYRWYVLGGIENTKLSMDNDDCDIENIICATYGRGFYTKDTNARLHLEDVLWSVARLWG